MQIDVPDDIVRRAEVNAGDLRTALAVQLYADNRIDHADACRLAAISDSQLDRELLSRALSVQQYRVWSSRGSRRSAG